MYYIKSKAVRDVTISSLGKVIAPGKWICVTNLTDEVKNLAASGTVEITRGKPHPTSMVGKFSQMIGSPKQQTPSRPPESKEDAESRRRQFPIRRDELSPPSQPTPQPAAQAEAIEDEPLFDQESEEKPVVAQQPEGGRTVLGDDDEDTWGI
jgi:hypothetical protein